MSKTDLSKYDNTWYEPGSGWKRFLWYFTHLFFFRSGLFPYSGFMKFWLRLYGAKIGKGVVFKPHVHIKYPWNLQVGNHSWIGEKVWIDNLGLVVIENNVCLSQGAMLECGNHNYSKSEFDLMVHEIVLREGVWIGAKAIVAGNVTCQSHSVLSAGSFTSKDLDSYSIYQGNPAVKIKERVIS